MKRESLMLTVREVAEMLRISQITVYRLVAKGELPALKIGRAVRYLMHARGIQHRSH